MFCYLLVQVHGAGNLLTVGGHICPVRTSSIVFQLFLKKLNSV